MGGESSAPPPEDIWGYFQEALDQIGGTKRALDDLKLMGKGSSAKAIGLMGAQLIQHEQLRCQIAHILSMGPILPIGKTLVLAELRHWSTPRAWDCAPIMTDPQSLFGGALLFPRDSGIAIFVEELPLSGAHLPPNQERGTLLFRIIPDHHGICYALADSRSAMWTGRRRGEREVTPERQHQRTRFLVSRVLDTLRHNGAHTLYLADASLWGDHFQELNPELLVSEVIDGNLHRELSQIENGHPPGLYIRGME